VARLPWAGEHQHGHGMHDPPPARPAGQLREVVRAHQPDEMRGRKAAFEHMHRVRRVARAQMRLDIRGDDPPPIGYALRGGQTRGQRRHAGGGLQRVAGRDHEPELVQAEMRHRLAGDVQMPLMCRVERPAEQPHPQTVAMPEAR